MTDGYLTKTQLIKERKWTDRIFRIFNPRVDKERKNYLYKSVKVCLFSIIQIEEIEAKEEFKKLMLKAEKKRSVANPQKAITTKVNKLLEKIEKMEVKVEKISKNKILNYAIQNNNEIKLERDNFDFTTKESDPAFLERLGSNYIRHELTNYDEGLEILKGKVGKKIAYEKFCSIVDEKIKEVYPEYVRRTLPECNFY